MHKLFIEYIIIYRNYIEQSYIYAHLEIFAENICVLKMLFIAKLRESLNFKL